MLNRRHIRTKVMQVIYALKRSEDLNLASEERFLISSMDSMYSLYLLMLSLLIKVHDKAKDQQEKSQQKHLLTSEVYSEHTFSSDVRKSIFEKCI